MKRQLKKLKEREYEKRRAGLCRVISCTEPLKGRQFCARHLEENNEKHRQLRRERRRQGLCLQCGASTGGKVLCERHREKKNHDSRKRALERRNKEVRNNFLHSIEERRSMGLCDLLWCSRPAHEGNRCEEHTKGAMAARQRERKRRRRDEEARSGICVICGWGSLTRVCRGCVLEENQKARERRTARRKAGFCACGRKRTKGYLTCSRCRGRRKKR